MLFRSLITVACPRYEPFGLTPFEAAASGCALICSRTGAFEDLVESGVNGLLVEPGDVTGLANALRSVLANVQSTEAMGQAALKRVIDRFSLDREAEGIASVYRRLFGLADEGPHA